MLTKDIYQPLKTSPVSSSRKLTIERATSVIVGAAATIFALSVPTIVDALLYSYTLWAPTIIVPLFAAVLFGIRSAPAALSGIAAGAVVTAVWQWVLPAPFGLDDGLIPGVLANLLVFTIVATVTANRYPPRRQAALVPQGELA